MTTLKEVTNSAEAQAIMPQVNRLYNSLEEFKVNSTGSWFEAGEKIKLAKDKIKEIKAVRKDFLDPINELKDTTMGFFEPALTKLEQIVDILGKKAADWRNEQLRKEQEARDKAEDEAREKERLEKERLRKEAEAKEKEAEKLRLAAQAAEKNGNYKQAQIKIEESQEKTDEAKEIKEEAKEVEVEVREVKEKAPKIAGLHFRTYWKFEIIDENKLPREFLRPDEVAINKYVSDNKEKAKIPGVRIYSKDSPVA